MLDNSTIGCRITPSNLSQPRLSYVEYYVVCLRCSECGWLSFDARDLRTGCMYCKSSMVLDLTYTEWPIISELGK